MDQSTTFEDFMAARKAAIKTQIAELRAELKKIQAAEAALVPLGGNDAPSVQSRASAYNGEPTIKQMILKVTEQMSGGATAEGIILAIKDAYNKEVPRSSMSPQLTRLKTAGHMIRENDRWKHPHFASGNFDGVSNPANDQQDDNMADEQDRHTQGEDVNGAMPRISKEGQAFDLGE